MDTARLAMMNAKETQVPRSSAEAGSPTLPQAQMSPLLAQPVGAQPVGAQSVLSFHLTATQLTPVRNGKRVTRSAAQSPRKPRQSREVTDATADEGDPAGPRRARRTSNEPTDAPRSADRTLKPVCSPTDTIAFLGLQAPAIVDPHPDAPSNAKRSRRKSPNAAAKTMESTMTARVPAPVSTPLTAPVPAPVTAPARMPVPDLALSDPAAAIYVGDCRQVIASLKPALSQRVDLVFADPPFNWNRAYDQWNDSMPREDYLQFTREWLDACIELLTPTGSMWVNIPDDTAAEIVVHLKSRGMHMANWCIWHYRFGQNTNSRFINSKVHALYFCKDLNQRTWNPHEIMEPSDRATTYFDARTQSKKDGAPPGMRLPMDVWYGQYWGRIQGNNAERRVNHDNQLPEVYLARVILACSSENDLVMDPFLGSGTTGVVAHDLKRRFVGIEYSAANAASAFERMRMGPARPVRQALNASSAIFAPRRKDDEA
ncbi:MAG: DNA methyltransferase [Planctomycetota bacterium]|nr:DNA methyltransferase [Planctomycetota bacterium]